MTNLKVVKELGILLAQSENVSFFPPCMNFTMGILSTTFRTFISTGWMTWSKMAVIHLPAVLMIL